MNAFIKNLVKSYFDDHRQEFGEDARYSEFLIVEGTAVKEDTYPADVYGFIMYTLGKTIRSSGRIRVQYYQCRENAERRLMMRAWFANEVFFHSRIWPLCANDSSRHLVPKFCASAEHVTAEVNMGAQVFECEAGFHSWGYMCRLDFNHLAMMADRVGQFHGRMLDTRARHEAQLSTAAQPLCTCVQLNAGEVIPTLERCIELLQQDRSFMERPGSAEGVGRLRRLVTQLDDHLYRQAVVNPDCFIVGHRNYTQSCGFFRYSQATPVDMHISYWAKVGWSSLADDLVILMFVDANARWELAERVRLIEYYAAGLRRGCPEGWLPTSEDIWREIRLRIPLALFALAGRVDGLGAGAIRAGRLETSVPWNEQFVVELYKLLISENLV